ncbi:hypothetical protein AUJ68_01170 [Candidatus Woesearchaeota archaeon CG1_02_57_44]|nr:MAG: hypothetical protein AUJ68_01170 [Candidatus Woesearchaeota archaeon CG1_02_57_44]
MDLRIQKRLASSVLGCSPKRVKLTPSDELKEAITKDDIRALVRKGGILRVQKSGVSGGRSRKTAGQKSKGRRQGHGSRSGKAGSRLGRKESWIARIRAQREFLKGLRERKTISDADYKTLYRKSGGGFFRSVRHMKLFIGEHRMVKK